MIPNGVHFAKVLEEAGVITDLNSITRIIIDIQPGDAARVYVERIGDKRLLDAFKGPLGMMLAESAPGPEPVRYWVHMSDELIADPDAMRSLEGTGLRIVRTGGRIDRYSQMVLIEDPAAPRELDGQHVELEFRRDDAGRDVIADRRVTA